MFDPLVAFKNERLGMNMHKHSSWMRIERIYGSCRPSEFGSAMFGF